MSQARKPDRNYVLLHGLRESSTSDFQFNPHASPINVWACEEELCTSLCYMLYVRTPVVVVVVVVVVRPIERTQRRKAGGEKGKTYNCKCDSYYHLANGRPGGRYAYPLYTCCSSNAAAPQLHFARAAELQ